MTRFTRYFASLLLLLTGHHIVQYWIEASEGYKMFRTEIPGDWLLAGILLFCFVTPFFLTIGYRPKTS
jgi:hypothetical protein